MASGWENQLSVDLFPGVITRVCDCFTAPKKEMPGDGDSDDAWRSESEFSAFFWRFIGGVTGMSDDIWIIMDISYLYIKHECCVYNTNN